MSELTEKIEALEKENQRLKQLDGVARNKVNGLKEIIRVLREEFPRHGEAELVQLLPQVVRVEF